MQMDLFFLLRSLSRQILFRSLPLAFHLCRFDQISIRQTRRGEGERARELVKKILCIFNAFHHRQACPRRANFIYRKEVSLVRCAIFEHHTWFTLLYAPLGRMRRYAGNLFCLCSMARKFARGTYASRAVPLRSDEYVDSIRLLVRSLLPSLPSILIRSRRRSLSRLKLQLSCYWGRIMRNRENAKVIAFLRSENEIVAQSLYRSDLILFSCNA